MTTDKTYKVYIDFGGMELEESDIFKAAINDKALKQLTVDNQWEDDHVPCRSITLIFEDGTEYYIDFMWLSDMGIASLVLLERYPKTFQYLLRYLTHMDDTFTINGLIEERSRND